MDGCVKDKGYSPSNDKPCYHNWSILKTNVWHDKYWKNNSVDRKSVHKRLHKYNSKQYKYLCGASDLEESQYLHKSIDYKSTF
jgi:hypothetical protein